jgi:hypothetical protein
MNAIQPLDGAMVFNTDDKCIFIFEGSSWKSLCNSGTDNQQISFDTISNILTLENGGAVDLSSYLDNTDNQTISLTGNTLTLSNGTGADTTADLSGYLDNTDSQDLSTDGTSGNISISNGSTLNLNVDDADSDASNELLTGANLTGTNLNLTDAGGTTTVDLSSLNNSGTDDQNLTSASIDASNILTIGIENGTPVTVDLSSYLDNTDNQNLTSASIDASNILTIGIENGTSVTVDLSSYLDNTDNQTISLTGNTLTLSNGTGADTTADLSGYVNNDTNEIQSLSQSGINVTLSNGGGTISVADNDNDAANEIQSISISGSDITLSKGGGTVTIPSEVITNLSQNTSNGVITYSNENATNQTANVVSTNTNNSVKVGTDGGAFFRSPIRAIGKIAGNGIVIKATSGITVTRISKGRYRVNLPSGLVSDANYIIQLTQPGRGGAGNDDPGISYNNQTTTSFEVIVGDNDNGGTDRSKYDSEFMFTVLDL